MSILKWFRTKDENCATEWGRDCGIKELADNDILKEYDRVYKVIDEVTDGLNVYPAAVRGFGDERDYEKRNGWNACSKEVMFKLAGLLDSMDKFKSKLTPEIKNKMMVDLVPTIQVNEVEENIVEAKPQPKKQKPKKIRERKYHGGK
jgi:hypothetical protein